MSTTASCSSRSSSKLVAQITRIRDHRATLPPARLSFAEQANIPSNRFIVQAPPSSSSSRRVAIRRRRRRRRPGRTPRSYARLSPGPSLGAPVALDLFGWFETIWWWEWETFG